MLQNHETWIEQLNSCTQIDLQNVFTNFTVVGTYKGGRGSRNIHGNDSAHTGGCNTLHGIQNFGRGHGGCGKSNGSYPTYQVCG